jgi:hypothetical protein
MSARCSPTFLSRTKKIAGIAIGAVALLATTWPALSADVLTLTTAIQVPNSALSVFDISWADPVMKKYFLADRNNKAIDIVDTTNNSITQSDAVFGGVGPPPASNPPAGPNGVWTVNHQEIWAGDGNRAVKVLDAKGKYITTITIPGSTGRVDEGCFDPRDQLVAAASNQETPWPWVNFIATSGPNRYKVVGTLVFDGLKKTLGTGHSEVMATNSVEQCQWDEKTGKIYVNIPANNGPPKMDTVPGAVVVIDPISMSEETFFTIPLSACAGPMGMAIGPENQILLGCSQNGSNSAIINARSGAVESILTGYAGTDEVWFNSGDGHYILPFCPASCRATSSPTPEQIGVIDSKGFRPDQSVTVASATTTPDPKATGMPRRAKSVAADTNTNQVYIPIPGISGPAPVFTPTICSSAPTKIGSPTNLTGCIAVFTFTTTE